MKKEEIYEYDKEKRRKAKRYSFSKLVSQIIGSIILPICILLILLWTGLAQEIASSLVDLTTIYLAVPLFILLLVLILSLISFPLDLYFGYFYEHKYGLSNQNLKEWFKDWSKSLFLSSLVSLIILSVIFALINLTIYWWLLSWIFIFLFLIFAYFIFPIFVVPLFYNLEPYEEKEHREKLIDLCKEAGVKEIKKIQIANESKRSKKPNAMFSGLGKTKNIILFDTLVNKFKKEEIENIVGHELGHYLNKDTFRLTLFNGAIYFIGLYLTNFLLRMDLFGIPRTSPALITLLLLLLSIYSIIGMPVLNWYSRKREFEADKAGLAFSQNPRSFISAFKRMADESLSDDNPSRLVETIFYTHPSIKRRIENIEEEESGKN